MEEKDKMKIFIQGLSVILVEDCKKFTEEKCAELKLSFPETVSYSVVTLSHVLKGFIDSFETFGNGNYDREKVIDLVISSLKHK